MATQPINFKTREGQRVALAAVDAGDLRFVDAYRLCFPEEKATLENMEIRELYDNAQMYQGRVI
jgi:hypothetical protein